MRPLQTMLLALLDSPAAGHADWTTRFVSCILKLGTVLGFSAPGNAQELLAVNDLATILRRHGIPGVGVCVVTNGVVSQIDVLGERKIGSKNPLSKGDLFHMGSCTKFMTVCLAQMAIQEGRLKWDARLAEIGERLAIPVDPVLREITLQELLACTAGFPEDRKPEAWPSGLLERLYSFNDNPREGRRLLAKTRIENAEGVIRDGKYRYSNLGYCLAGILIEEAYDRAWEDLMREKLFVPLKMDSAGFGAPAWADPTRQPWGHRGGHPVGAGPEADNPQAIGPAGTVRMSIEDMGRYLQFVLGHQSILPQETFDQLLRNPSSSEFAHGWLTQACEWANGTVWITTGSNTSFFTMLLVAPGIGFAIAVAVNCGDDTAPKACQDVTNLAIERLKSNREAEPGKRPANVGQEHQ